MDLVRRRNMYIFLSELAHDLLHEIYSDYEGFINARERGSHAGLSPAKEIHPLEEYIITYDENMEEDGIIIELGERIGFGLDYDETLAYTPPEQFYDRCSYTIRNNEPTRIKKIMNMTEEEYKHHLKGLNITFTKDIYADRLNIDSHKYNKDLINAFLNLLEDDNPSISERLSLIDEGIIKDTLIPVNPGFDRPLKQVHLEEYEDKFEDEVMNVKKIRNQIMEGPTEEDLETIIEDEENRNEDFRTDMNDEDDE